MHVVEIGNPKLGGVKVGPNSYGENERVACTTKKARAREIIPAYLVSTPLDVEYVTKQHEESAHKKLIT